MSSINKREFLLITAIVWTALTIVSVVMIMYTGVDGVIFTFIVFIVTVLAWARVIRTRDSTDLLVELNSKISELSAKIDELKKAMEE
jgi:membrane protein implicated in regulation of membrane protease activity